MEMPHPIVTPTHSIKTSATRVKSVRTAKIDPVTAPARKWHATTDIKAFPSSGAVPEARSEKVTDASKPKKYNQKLHIISLA
jgi:hypothetical protein